MPVPAVAATLVTVPLPLPLNVVQSVDVKYPFTEVVAAGIEMTGVVPPVDATGLVAVTDVTVPLDGVTQVGALVALLCRTCPNVPT